MNDKLPLEGVLKESISIGVKNLVPLLGAFFLWILTIWIPYLNVGTSIAICTIPLELSKGNVINPLFIFEAKYRRYMGEYFILMGLMSVAIFVAALFLLVPAYVIGIAWSLAIYLLLDKNLSPTEAIMESNRLTYGYKWKIFGLTCIIGLLYNVVGGIVSLIPVVGSVLNIIALAFYMVITWACWAVIYRNLTAKEESVLIEE